jgi:hypothetical protein
MTKEQIQSVTWHHVQGLAVIDHANERCSLSLERESITFGLYAGSVWRCNVQYCIHYNFTKACSLRCESFYIAAYVVMHHCI